MDMSGAPLYPTPGDLQAACDNYFDVHIDEKGNVPSIEGLSYFLGYAGREEFSKQKRRAGFTLTVNRVRARIADYKLSAAAKGELNATITIFDMINNHGYINTRSENKNDNKNTTTLTVAQAIEAENNGE